MEIWKLTEENKQELAGKAALQILEGKVVVCPTDTVYGLLADATNADAVSSVFRMKGREEGKAFPVFLPDAGMVTRYGYIEEAYERALGKLWPGRVTLVLKSKGLLAKGCESMGSVALRVPGHEFVRSLMALTGKPLTGTSANVSGAMSCKSGAEAVEQFRDRSYAPDILIDGGELSLQAPSTIVDLTSVPPRILRHGAVAREKLVEVFGEIA